MPHTAGGNREHGQGDVGSGAPPPQPSRSTVGEAEAAAREGFRGTAEEGQDGWCVPARGGQSAANWGGAGPDGGRGPTIWPPRPLTPLPACGIPPLSGIAAPAGRPRANPARPLPCDADEEVMHVGRRVYISNLAWRTSWQDLKDKCVGQLGGAAGAPVQPQQGPMARGGAQGGAGGGGRERAARLQQPADCLPACTLHSMFRSLQVPRVRQRCLLQRHQG
jgi:hypothetical protein